MWVSGFEASVGETPNVFAGCISEIPK